MITSDRRINAKSSSLRFEADAEWMAGRIRQHPPAIATGLEFRGTGTQLGTPFLGLVEIVHIEIEMELLRRLRIRPARRLEPIHPAESDRRARLRTDHRVLVLAVADLPAEHLVVELRQRGRTVTVEIDHRNRGKARHHTTFRRGQRTQPDTRT